MLRLTRRREGRGEGVVDGGREWSALGGPRVPLNPTVVILLLVEILRA